MDKSKIAMLSTTLIDLPEYRQRVVDACSRLGIIPKWVDGLSMRDAEVMKASIEIVDEADMYIGVYAWRDDYIPKGYDISIVEMEFNRAVERKIPIFVFLMHNDHPQAQEKIAAFQERVSKEHIVATFKSPEELHTQVLQALSALAERDHTQTSEPAVTETASTKGNQDLSTATPASANVDPLLLAWHLVVDFKAEPELLLHLDPTRFREAIDKFGTEAGFERGATWEQKLALVHQYVQDKHHNDMPNALWLAWINNLHAFKVNALKQLPAAANAASGVTTDGDGQGPG